MYFAVNLFFFFRSRVPNAFACKVNALVLLNIT